MANDLNRSIKIYIDGSEAQQGIAKVEAAVQKLEAKLSSLNKGEADYEAKSKELQKELNAKTRTLETYRKKVEETDRVLKNLSGATYQELLVVQKQVRKDLQNAVPGTEKYNAALEQNRRVTQQMAAAQKAMRVEVGSQGNMWLRASNFINQYLGIIGTLIAAVTGLTLKLNQLREARNKREEAKADVQALTGLDEESIAWLEQQAQRLSTSMDENGIRIRQSATEILDAYKLVGSAKPELLQDKEALNDVTKQALILAQASGMTLKDAVDAVTLSLNQFGDGADQAARYTNVMAAGSKYGSAAVESVTKALRNSGVAAASANVSIEQTVGMIEALAEKGIKDEVAGTGLKKFFLTLQTGADETNPKIVGLETALDNLAAKQLNATKIKEMFGEEGYNVASVLINETEKVKYYTQAVTGTGVAIEQAGIKSQTAAAKLDQAKNKMQEMGIALMEKLNPGLVSAANGIVNWTQKGVKLVDFIVRHIGVITTLTASIAAYYAGVKIATLWETKLKDTKLASIAVDKMQAVWNKTLLSGTLLLSSAKYALTGNIKLAAAAWKQFSLLISKNPFGLLLTVLTAVGVGLYQLATRSNEATEGIARMNGELISEQHSLDSLFGALKRTAEGSQQRRDIIQQINDKYGTYLPNLLTEKSNLDEINEAYKRINRTLVTQLAMKYKNEEIGNITSEAAKTQVEVIEGMRKDLVKSLGSNELATVAINEVKQITNEFYSAGVQWEKAFGQAWHTIRTKYLGKNSIAKGLSEDMADYIQSVYDMNRKLDKVENKYASWMPGQPANELPEVTVTGNAPKKSGASSVDDKEAEKQRRAALEREKVLYEQAQAEITRIYAEGKNAELQTEQQYNDRLLAEKKKYLQRVMEVSGSGTKESADAEKQLAEIQLQERQESIKRAVEEENRLYAEQQRQLKELYANGNDENLDSHQQYIEALEQLEMVHLHRMLEIAGLDAEARKQIEDKLLEYKIKCLKEYEDEQNKRSKKEKTSTKRDSRTLEQEYQQRFSRMKGYADEFGSALGEVISGQKSAMEALGDATIDIIYNVLNQMINAWLTQLAAKAAAATAEGSMTEIGTKGVAGIATSAVIAATVSGLLAAARTALKGLIGTRDGGSSSSGDSETTYQRVPTVNQYASGRYNVIGASDGRSYTGVPYIGPAPTGIVNSPALISERGSELIVNADDLRRLQKHINYPLVVQTINESRGHITQYSQGNYTMQNIPSLIKPTNEPLGIDSDLIQRLTSAIEHLEREGIQADVVLTELERKQKQRERSRKIGSK
ncbi:phage tail tape measure protein [Bacteroides sp. ET489]|uniref:phage tail tape measure protein n=1 Tax=Bacteroides sp. ET489 TaxID=3057126 RepID=UPI00267386BA|nr:phage tail tape measure protein [Bacteroides sp. ET489]MDO3391882.1 phage tail tape measure protein [Bacteroides sp. ET489]